MKHEFIKEIDTKNGTRCLIKITDKYYVVSSIPCAFDTGKPETLAFAANRDGEVTSYTDLAGGKYKSREQTIVELEELGAKPGARGWDGEPGILGLMAAAINESGKTDLS